MLACQSRERSRQDLQVYRRLAPLVQEAQPSLDGDLPGACLGRRRGGFCYAGISLLAEGSALPRTWLTSLGGALRQRI